MIQLREKYMMMMIHCSVFLRTEAGGSKLSFAGQGELSLRIRLNWKGASLQRTLIRKYKYFSLYCYEQQQARESSEDVLALLIFESKRFGQLGPVDPLTIVLTP